MVLTDARRERLQDLLSTQQARTYDARVGSRDPSKFRELALDTHKTAPAEYWGPAVGLSFPQYGPTRKSMSAQQRTRPRDNGNILYHSMGETALHSSVFKPTAEQQHLTNLSRTQRDIQCNSEWALVNTFDVQMYNDERDHIRQSRQRAYDEQRRYLDGQIREKEFLTAKANAEKEREKQMVNSQVDKYKEEESKRNEALRLHRMKLNEDRAAQLQAVKDAQQRAREKKARDDERLAAQLKLQQEKDKETALRKAEEAKVRAAAALQENLERIAAKKEADRLRKLEEEKLMQETIRTLERQEKEREDALKEFYANVSRRSDAVGQVVVQDRREREEREAKLQRLYEEKAAKEAAARDRAALKKKEQAKQDILKNRSQYLAAQREKEAAKKSETEKLRIELEAKAVAEKQREIEKQMAWRARNMAVRNEVETQILQSEQRRVEEDARMTETERRINHAILREATKAVGYPHQIPVKFL